jgi:hypothetical protein
MALNRRFRQSCWIAGWVFCMGALQACGSGDEATGQKVAELEKRISASEAMVQDLQKQVEDAKKEIGRLSVDQVVRSMEDAAYLTPGESGYSVLKGNVSALTVALQDVQPFASGSKVTLHFGNPSSATIDGVKIQIDWGKLGKNKIPDIASQESREVELSKSLLAGSWTDVEVVLEGTPPAQLGFLNVKLLGHRSIRLRRSYE